MPGRWRQTTAAPTRIALEQRRGNGREVARRRRYTYQRGWFRIINVRLATRIACRQRQLTEAHLIKRALHPTADLQRVGVDHGGSTSAWPSNSCTVRMFEPPCSKAVAKAWRSECADTGLSMPASKAARLSARCKRCSNK